MSITCPACESHVITKISVEENEDDDPEDTVDQYRCEDCGLTFQEVDL